MRINDNENVVLEKSRDIINEYVQNGCIPESASTLFAQIVEMIKSAQEQDVVEPQSSSTETFEFKEYLDGYMINKYIGFSDAKVVIPSTFNGKKVLSIGEGCLAKLEELEEVVLPPTLEIISTRAFEECYNLKKINFPSNLKVIGDWAFHKTALQNIQFPSSLFYIGEYSFGNTNIEKISIPGNLVSIGHYAFRNCKKLREVYFSDGTKLIGKAAFSDCVNLKKVILPSSLEIIKKEAFCNCESLKEVDIPKSVVKIEDYAFHKRYIVQPDRRYNPWIEYEPLSEIVIKCFPGNIAQNYARNNRLKHAQSTYLFSETTNKTQYGINLHYFKDANLDIKVFDILKDNSDNWGYMTSGPFTEVYCQYPLSPLTESALHTIKVHLFIDKLGFNLAKSDR